MRNGLSTPRSSKRLTSIATFCLFLVLSFVTAQAQTTTFAQFFEQVGTQDFVFTNNTSSAAFNNVGGGSAVFFIYQNIVGLPVELQGIQSGRMFVSTTTTAPATLDAGTLKQPMNQTVTVQIIRDVAASSGGGSRTNLLTAVFSPNVDTPAFAGAPGGNSATLSSTTPNHNVTFTSDFLIFGLTTQRNLGLSFSSVTPAYAVGAGGFLQSFTAAASGTFASSPPPTPFILTAAGVAVGGRVIDANGQPVRNVNVILTQMDGTMVYARTNSFGRFQFASIASGQTVVVSAFSKSYSFADHVLNLDNDVRELDFIASF